VSAPESDTITQVVISSSDNQGPYSNPWQADFPDQRTNSPVPDNMFVGHESSSSRMPPPAAPRRRPLRSEEKMRYLTAGAVDDLKVGFH
jgi:hypothetical protein